jgi:hypothetical protein
LPAGESFSSSLCLRLSPVVAWSVSQHRVREQYRDERSIEIEPTRVKGTQWHRNLLWVARRRMMHQERRLVVHLGFQSTVRPDSGHWLWTTGRQRVSITLSQNLESTVRLTIDGVFVDDFASWTLCPFARLSFWTG